MTLDQKRWLLLLVSCIINLFAGSIYAWSVFASPLTERIGSFLQTSLTSADLAIAFSIANALGPIPMIFGGLINDRFGPKFVIAAGGISMGFGLYASGNAESVSGLIVSYGLFFGTGLSLVYGCTINNTLKFFPDHRGLVGGLATAAYGISSVLVPPIATQLISVYGITNALEIMGVFIGGVIVIGGFLSMRCPVGFTPSMAVQKQCVEIGRNYTWREMLRDARFLPMITLLTCGATAGMMVISQSFFIARHQIALDVASAAMAVSCMALANTFGRLCAGTASDYLGRLPTLGAGLGIAIIGLILLALGSPANTLPFYCGLIALGFSFGCFMGVYPGFTAQVFGARHNGVNFGIMFTGFALAGILGPTLMQLLSAMGFSETGHYCAAGTISALGFVMMFLYWKAERLRIRSK